MNWKLPLAVTHDDYIFDATGGIIPLDEIVAALNAPQPLAFEKLTLAKLHEIIEEDIDDPESMTGDASSLLRRLQVFAAQTPAELVKKLKAPDLLNAHADAMAFARTRADPASPSGLMFYGEHMRASIARLLSEGGAA